jgi:hypothetical protein
LCSAAPILAQALAGPNAPVGSHTFSRSPPG